MDEELNKHLFKGDIQMATRYMNRSSISVIIREIQVKSMKRMAIIKK